VPYVSASPIHTQEVFEYEYPILQSGTYWYHSHFALQEQLGVPARISSSRNASPCSTTTNMSSS